MKTPSITCPACGMTSYNLNDIREGYCGKCHAFTGKPEQFDACLRGRHGSQEQEGPTPAQEHAMGFAAWLLCLNHRIQKSPVFWNFFSGFFYGLVIAPLLSEKSALNTLPWVYALFFFNAAGGMFLYWQLSKKQTP